MDNYTKIFVNGMINGNFDLEEFINSVSSSITFNINKLKSKELYLYDISTFLNIPFDVWTINGTTQTMEELTFGYVLQYISTKNCHNEGEFKCRHHCESLLSHLVFAMLKCMEKLPSSMGKRQQIQLMILALLHDVGKYGCTCLLKHNENKVTGFTFHGEYGAGILIKLWHNGFSSFFNKNEWEDMVRTVSVHMCGYHEITTSTIQSKFKHSLLQSESLQVKDNLYWLSIADIEGRCSEIYSKQDLKEYIAFREIFKKILGTPFNLKEFKKIEKLNGCIIQLCGMNGSGKSNLSVIIKNYLESTGVNKNAIVTLDHDIVISNVIAQRRGIEMFIDKPINKEFLELYAEYSELQLGDIVNKKMRNIIDLAIRKGKIIIVETRSHLFRNIDSIYPDSAICTLKLAIDVLRNCPFSQSDVDRTGLCINKQVSTFGNLSVLNWLPYNSLPGKCGTGRLKYLSSISSESSNVEHIRKDIQYKSRPHFRYQIAWDLGHSSLFHLLNYIGHAVEYNSNSDDNYNEMDITRLIDSLYQQGNHKNVKQFFNERAFLCLPPALMKGTEYEHSSFYIKYCEHCRIFSPKFSRQGRGSIFMKLPSGNFVCVKNLLQRGVEYLTEHHIKKGITESENIKANEEWSHLDIIQQETMNRFISDSYIDGWLSFKNDGSLSGINLYPKGTEVYNVISDLINKSTDPRDVFSKMMLEESNKKKLPFLPVLCSQGTLTMTEKMLPYNVTAICCGLCNINYNTLCTEVSKGLNPTEAMKIYAIDTFLENLFKFWEKAPVICKKETMCLSFEAIVPHRRCAWGCLHQELALSYNVSSYKFLGCMFLVGKTSGKYRAHFQLDELVNNTIWDQPMCWPIKHTREAESMILDIGNIIREKITEKEFIKKYKPINKMASCTFDYEGFVFFTNIQNTDPIGLEKLEFDYDVDYGKIKSEEYYKCHKLKEENIDFLLSIPSSSTSIIPLAKVVQEIYPNFIQSLYLMSDELRIILNKASEYDHDVFHSLPNGKVKESFKTKEFIVKSKMIINISLKWRLVLFQSYQNLLGPLPDEEKIHIVLKKIVMKIEIWNDDYKLKINQMVNNKDNMIKELFHITVQSKGIVL